MKQQKSTSFLVMMLVISSLIFLYPIISDYWNSFHQTGVIQNYDDIMKDMQDENYDDILSLAKEYNEKLASSPKEKYENGEPVDKEYASLLKIGESNVMGYISIDKINLKLPIYHGTAESVLSIGTGHLEGSSLPIGGESTHTVITGHRGLASATLFTNLNEIELDDIFTLNVLSQTLTYKVDQLLIVPPEEIDAISIEKGEDYCTLVTCTPFGINTDRILVRGKRVENIEELDIKVTSNAQIIDPIIVFGCILVPLVIIFMSLSFCVFPLKREE